MEILDACGRAIDESFFWNGGCAAFALTLARHLRRRGEIADIAVISRVDGELWSEDYEFEFTHVVVSVKNGYLDVLGFHDSIFEIARRIDIATHDKEISIEGDWDVDVFERCFMGTDDEKPLYPADEETSDWAARLIEAHPERYVVPAVARTLSMRR